MSVKFWAQPLGKALGEVRRDVKELVASHGEVRQGFLDRTGFQTIFQTAPEQTGLDLALEALQAVDHSWLRANVDTVIYVTSTGDRVAPGNGHLLHRDLGLKPETLVLDLNDACTGFLRSLLLSQALLESSASRTILVVLSDTYSKLYADQNLRISPLFSDGASAFIFSESKPSIPNSPFPPRHWEILSSVLVSDGALADELTIKRSGTDFPYGELDMNGAGVFSFVVRHLKSSVYQALESVELGIEEIDRWYLHQGSRVVVEAACKAFSLDPEKQFVSRDYGNVVGSSIPFQLISESNHDSLKNQKIVLVAFGVGLTLSAIIIRQAGLK